MLQAASTKTQTGGLKSSPQFHFSKFNSFKVVDCSQLQAEHQSFTLSQQERNSVIFVIFLSISLSRCHPAVLVPILVLLGGPAVHTHYSLLPPLTDELNEHNPCLPVRSWESPTSKLGIWIISVIFSFSSSWYGPDSVVFSISCLHSFTSPLLSDHLSRSLQIADLYKKQQQIQNQGEKADPEDYYWYSLGQQ